MDNYEIDSLRREVQNKLGREDKSIDDEQKRRTNEWLDRHREILAQVKKAGGYEQFVLSYIQGEQSRNLRGTGGTLRERPLCTCPPSNCPLKQGRLPREIKEADTVDEGIDRFRSVPYHFGEPIVLSEAQDVYAELMMAADEVYREALVIVSGDGEPRESPVTLSKQARDALGIDAPEDASGEATA